MLQLIFDKNIFKQLLQTDKLLHNFINYIIVFTLAILVNYWVGLVTAIIVSLLKEFIWDKLLKKGCFEVVDLVANALGIFEASVMYLMFLLVP